MRVVAVLFVVAVLAGCGGAGGSARIASKADFIAAADKVCVTRDARSKQLVREANNDVGRLTRGLADAYASAIVQISALHLPPGAGRAGAEKFVRAVEAMRRPVQRMKASAERFRLATSVPQIKAAGSELQTNVNTVQAIGDLADQNARIYGMKNCGQQQAQPIN